MTKPALAGWLLLLYVPATALAKDKPPFSWPPLPSPAAIEAATKMAGEAGLVMVDRRCTVDIHSYGASPVGTSRDDFMRFLVVSEEGVRGAAVDVNDDPNAKISLVEGRTVAPDGTVTPVDQQRDVTRLEIRKLREKKAEATLATVRFPAPSKGAILDLHFVTTSDSLVYYYGDVMGYKAVPLLNSQLDITALGGFSTVAWSVLAFGEAEAELHRDENQRRTVHARLGPYTPGKREPESPPEHQLSAAVLLFLDLYPMRAHTAEPAGSFASFEVDGRGRVFIPTYLTQGHKDYWVGFLTDQKKDEEDFLHRPGGAAEINVAALAPPALSLEERLARLYNAAQDAVTYNPDAGSGKSLSAVLKDGMDQRWEGTLLLSHLLSRAGIAHKVGVVANRYAMRFSPVVTNEYLYGFDKVVMVEVPGKAPLFMMPGAVDLPFGALPDVYQDSIAMFLQGDNEIAFRQTPADPLRLDGIKYAYDLALDATGSASGPLSLTETGASGMWFARWSRYRDFRRTHPSKEDKATSQKERDEEAEHAIRDEFALPGTALTLSGFASGEVPAKPRQSVQLRCTANGKGLAQPAGDRWLVLVNPVMAGFANPFTENRRRQAIWYDKGGHIVIDGDIRLPAGAKVVDLPKPSTIAGPEGASASVAVEQRATGDAVAIHTHMEIDRPSIVGAHMYAEWRAFQEGLATIARDRCVITMPAAKALE